MTTLTTPATDRIRSLIAEHLPRLIDIRHDLHAHPELKYEEVRTSGVVKRELTDAGIDFVDNLAGGTGVLAHLPGSSGGNSGELNAIGLRADMDALPILEATGLPYESTIPGKMHACGHDGHTTMLIGAARVLAKLSQEGGPPRPVTFVFQPAEEGGAGGKRMIEDGCLDGSLLGPPIEMMFGLHCWPELKLGQVATREGPMLAASDAFEITVRGRGAHAAYPQFGADPILASSAMVTAFQQIVSRNVNPLDSVVVSVTQFHAGSAFNIIPGEVNLGGTVRTLTPETRELAQRRLREIAEQTARAHDCAADLDYQIGYPVTCNDPAAVAIFNQTAIAALGDDRVEELARPVMGGEDFAFYGEVVPACFFALGIIPTGRDSMPKVHQPTFNFNDDAMATGIELFCRLAYGSQIVQADKLLCSKKLRNQGQPFESQGGSDLTGKETTSSIG